MRIAVANTLKSRPKALIIPVEKPTDDSTAFSQVAEWTKMDAATLQADFQAECGEVQVCYTSDTKFFLLGLGEQPDSAKYIKAFRLFSHRHHKKISDELGVFFPRRRSGFRQKCRWKQP